MIAGAPQAASRLERTVKYHNISFAVLRGGARRRLPRRTRRSKASRFHDNERRKTGRAAVIHAPRDLRIERTEMPAARRERRQGPYSCRRHQRIRPALLSAWRFWVDLAATADDLTCGLPARLSGAETFKAALRLDAFDRPVRHRALAARSLAEVDVQLADAFNGHRDLIGGILHCADTGRSAATNQIPRTKRHVVGDPADQLLRAEYHVRNGKVLALGAI